MIGAVHAVMVRRSRFPLGRPPTTARVQARVAWTRQARVAPATAGNDAGSVLDVPAHEHIREFVFTATSSWYPQKARKRPIAANPATADSMPSMKRVASRSSTAATATTATPAARGGMTLSLITLTEEARQFLSFASAVVASVAMRYAAMSARANSTRQLRLTRHGFAGSRPTAIAFFGSKGLSRLRPNLSISSGVYSSQYPRYTRVSGSTFRRCSSETVTTGSSAIFISSSSPVSWATVRISSRNFFGRSSLFS